ncbi:hypothetical protein RB620_24505 [Paenibacillus sp. LHD-117]|uniref:hypothetical protein n=1 Tax=Paenibacillus sp. LHD-117 TaxID=3071412 RepID=UPI0027E12977|nr:hypothetical protein [Paenibacillus sp. LHD-117]MDQ6422598.1 hypothetical protein [Paenibacillus sp. LHD-117]
MSYERFKDGWYRISDDASAAECVEIILQLIREHNGIPPIRFDFNTASGGFADGIGMGLSRKYNIQVDFTEHPGNRMSVFYLERQQV